VAEKLRVHNLQLVNFIDLFHHFSDLPLPPCSPNPLPTRYLAFFCKALFVDKLEGAELFTASFLAKHFTDILLLPLCFLLNFLQKVVNVLLLFAALNFHRDSGDRVHD